MITNRKDYRSMAIELMDDGVLSPDMLIIACLKWMSNHEVGEMLEANELLEEEVNCEKR